MDDFKAMLVMKLTTVTSEILEGMFFQGYPANMQSKGTSLLTKNMPSTVSLATEILTLEGRTTFLVPNMILKRSWNAPLRPSFPV